MDNTLSEIAGTIFSGCTPTESVITGISTNTLFEIKGTAPVSFGTLSMSRTFLLLITPVYKSLILHICLLMLTISLALCKTGRTSFW